MSKSKKEVLLDTSHLTFTPRFSNSTEFLYFLKSGIFKKSFGAKFLVNGKNTYFVRKKVWGMTPEIKVGRGNPVVVSKRGCKKSQGDLPLYSLDLNPLNYLKFSSIRLAKPFWMNSTPLV